MFTTPKQRTCADWHALDKRFDTDDRSPLHHDNRCERCHQRDDIPSILGK